MEYADEVGLGHRRGPGTVVASACGFAGWGGIPLSSRRGSGPAYTRGCARGREDPLRVEQMFAIMMDDVFFRKEVLL